MNRQYKDPEAQSLGRKGGLATKAKYGKAHYIKLALRMNEVRRAKARRKKQNEK